MIIGTHAIVVDASSVAGEMYICSLCNAQGTKVELMALPCLAATSEPEQRPREAHGVRTWFTPDGPISEMIYTDEDSFERLTIELIDNVIGSINPADLETQIMQSGAQHGYEHMVHHTLRAIQTQLHDRVHARTTQASKDGR